MLGQGLGIQACLMSSGREMKKDDLVGVVLLVGGRHVICSASLNGDWSLAVSTKSTPGTGTGHSKSLRCLIRFCSVWSSSLEKVEKLAKRETMHQGSAQPHLGLYCSSREERGSVMGGKGIEES